MPDLKEAEGGLRDATVLKALVATWLVDVPHVELERSRLALLDVRDLVHDIAGRATDRIAPGAVGRARAARLGVADARAAQVHVRELGRRITHLSRLTWRRVDDVLARPGAAVGARRPALDPASPRASRWPAARSCWTGGARPAEDPALLLRAAAEAAERDVVLAPPTAARLARECAPLPDPWPAEARRLLVRLLASGRGLLGDLGDARGDRRARPDPARVGADPAAAARLGDPPVHRRPARRRDLHRGLGADPPGRPARRAHGRRAAARHRQGQPHRAQRRRRADRPRRSRPGWASTPTAVDLIALLVRWHLLLAETATTRDPDDPATVELLASRLGTAEALDLLTALTEADARAASPKAWSSWRSGLILDLVPPRPGRARPAAPRCPPVVTDDGRGARARCASGGVSITVEPVDDGVAGHRDRARPGRAARRLRGDVRAAADRRSGPRGPGRRSSTASRSGRSPRSELDAGRAAAALRRDPGRPGRPGAPAGAARPTEALAPTVVVRPEASAQATVLEVRAADRPGVVYLVCAALAGLDVAVRSAHVDTLGPQAVDVFYLQEAVGRRARATRARRRGRARRPRTAPGRSEQSGGPSERRSRLCPPRLTA